MKTLEEYSEQELTLALYKKREEKEIQGRKDAVALWKQRVAQLQGMKFIKCENDCTGIVFIEVGVFCSHHDHMVIHSKRSVTIDSISIGTCMAHSSNEGIIIDESNYSSIVEIQKEDFDYVFDLCLQVEALIS